MNEIFADTAMTTLREQASAESTRGKNHSAPHDAAAKIVDKASLDDLFGDSSDKWATLAFSPTLSGK